MGVKCNQSINITAAFAVCRPLTEGKEAAAMAPYAETERTLRCPGSRVQDLWDMGPAPQRHSVEGGGGWGWGVGPPGGGPPGGDPPGAFLLGSMEGTALGLPFATHKASLHTGMPPTPAGAPPARMGMWAWAPAPTTQPSSSPHTSAGRPCCQAMPTLQVPAFRPCSVAGSCARSRRGVQHGACSSWLQPADPPPCSVAGSCSSQLITPRCSVAALTAGRGRRLLSWDPVLASQVGGGMGHALVSWVMPAGAGAAVLLALAKARQACSARRPRRQALVQAGAGGAATASAAELPEQVHQKFEQTFSRVRVG